MELKKIVSWLAENGYVIENNNRYLFTAKFNREVSGLDVGIQVIDHLIVKQKPEKVKEPNWILLYQKIIQEANIPRVSDDGRGKSYQINMATKPGREAFRKAIQEGETYESLLQSLKNYYGTTKSFLVKVEKFFVDELWRSQIQENRSTGGGVSKPRLV